jgi:hypothetical protein
MRGKNIPKPPWKEMVAPYKRESQSPTIRNHLKYGPGWVWASRNRKLWAIPLAPYIERYGLDLTFMELRERLKADGGLSLPTFGRNNEYRFPPIDRVPLALRGYALIDPTYLPAPLRG